MYEIFKYEIVFGKKLYFRHYTSFLLSGKSNKDKGKSQSDFAGDVTCITRGTSMVRKCMTVVKS